MDVTKAVVWGLGMRLAFITVAWYRSGAETACMKLLLCSLQDYSMQLVGLTESLHWGVGNSLTLAPTSGPPSQIWPPRGLDWVHAHVKVRKLICETPSYLQLHFSLLLLSLHLFPFSFPFLFFPSLSCRYDLCSWWFWRFKPENSWVLPHNHQNLVIHSTHAHLQKVSWGQGTGRGSLCCGWLWCHYEAQLSRKVWIYSLL